MTDIPSDREAASADVRVINNVSKGESEGDEVSSPTEVFNAVGKTGNGDITADLYKPNEIAFSEAGARRICAYL